MGSKEKLPESDARRLFETVVLNGYCVGCGACAAIENTPFQIRYNKNGQYAAFLDDNSEFRGVSVISQVCPFSSNAASEDQICDELFSSFCSHDATIGYFLNNYVGYIREGEFRSKGSSGGFGTWILNELFKQGLVDHVVHVRPRLRNGETSQSNLFEYAISESIDVILSGSKSRYYPIELSGVVREIRERPGRYVVIGLPCFVKSIRLLQKQDSVIRERINYCVGLVCGHLKSLRYTDSLAWQIGIHPRELEAIDFRVKEYNTPANSYSTTAESSSVAYKVPTKELFGTDWGMGVFKYKACDFCDDVFAETADVALGDAWLPEYVADSKGTNILVVRNESIDCLLKNAREQGRIMLNELPLPEVIKSQDAGIRHKKYALGYRLYLEGKRGKWTPPKRTYASSRISRREARKQELRIVLRETSHLAFRHALEADSLLVYFDAIKPICKKYKSTVTSIIKQCVVGLIQRFLCR